MAPKYFATLTPANPRAKAAFSAVVEENLLRGQDSSPIAFELTTSVSAERVFDEEVSDYLRQEQARSGSGQNLSDESTTDMETDVEGEPKDRVLIWSGYYLFSFDSIHPEQLGWQAGKGSRSILRLANAPFAKQHDPSLRSTHARFNFDTAKKSFFVARESRKSDVELAVNGESVTPANFKYYLNQHHMNIRISSLVYEFQYSDFARTLDYQDKRDDYLRNLGPVSGLLQYDMPTPLPDTRTIQKWTLHKPLGKGGSGRVSLASNRYGQVVAIKVVTKDDKTARAVEEEVRILQMLRDAEGSEEDKARIVQLEDVISSHEAVDKANNPFDEVALVLTPAMSSTLDSAIQTLQNRHFLCNEDERGGRCMWPKNAKFFCEALRGLRFLHSKGLMHGDLKPQNIGIAYNPERAVLLDLGSAREVNDVAGTSGPRPGGTIPYLSPEREMYYCGMPADIWAWVL